MKLTYLEQSSETIRAEADNEWEGRKRTNQGRQKRDESEAGLA